MTPAPHVAILGSGPAGLAIASCLQDLRVSFTLLERGDRIAAGIRKIDPRVEVLSPLRLSRIPGMQKRDTDPSYVNFGEYVERIDRMCEQLALEARTGTEVQRVCVGPKGFEIECSDGSNSNATHVVNATGITSHPVLPEAFEPERATYRWLHSLDVRAEDLRESRRLLIVGGGQSAAECIEEWLELPASSRGCWLSLRSGLRSAPRRILGIDVHYLIWPFEFLDARFTPLDPLRFRDPMLGSAAKRAIRDGRIESIGEIEDFGGNALTTREGQRVEPDLVVFATGFRYAMDHLGELLEFDARGWPRVHRCESRETPGLYLLGMRHSCTLASAYLRGIARDARSIARRIAAV